MEQSIYIEISLLYWRENNLYVKITVSLQTRLILFWRLLEFCDMYERKFRWLNTKNENFKTCIIQLHIFIVRKLAITFPFVSRSISAVRKIIDRILEKLSRTLARVNTYGWNRFNCKQKFWAISLSGSKIC